MLNKFGLVAIAAWMLLAVNAGAAEKLAPIVDEPERVSAEKLAASCAKLDNLKERQRMDGLLYKLLIMCGRQDELGRVKSEKFKNQAGKAPGTDALVNDPTGEFSGSQTQNETSLARNEVTGTLCSGFNDSFSGVTSTGGFTGFARSTDDGASFTDGGALSANSFGDPSLVWRRSDGNFYFATLHSNGLGLWRSTDDCGTFAFIGMIHTGTADDKEILTVDNAPGSPFYGRMHVSWTNFDDARIYNTFSSNGGASWSTPVALSGSGVDVQGAWPAVAPDGTVYVTWVRWNPYFSGPIDVEVARSTNGGTSFSLVTNPLTGAINPYESGPTSACGRPAISGNIRYLPSPQMVVAPNGDVAVVYSYDPDGRDTGDAVDVFFRRSTNQGLTWEPEIQLNDDGTLRDQFFPTLSVGPSGRYMAAWYDRRLDPGNVAVDYYARLSEDGGATWTPSQRVSDVSSPIYLDPGLATCYHGDYDQQVQSEAAAYIQWADDRAVRSGHNDPDTYLDKNTLEPDFSVSAGSSSAAVCAPDSAGYLINVNQALGFSDPVTLSTSGTPAGTGSSFSVNPVTPPASSTLSVSITGGALPGDYTIDVDGTDGSVVRSTQVQYLLSTAAPAAPGLISPVNGATDQAITPELIWTATAQASSYIIEVATDAAFTSIIAADTVATNSYTVAAGLSPDTTYFWRVRATNICGTAPDSAVNSFTTGSIICTSPALAIVDNSTVSSSVPLADTGVLDSLAVSVDASHTWVGDVTMTLVHVDTGTSVVLMDRPGYSGAGFGCEENDIDAEFNDTSGIAVESECSTTPPAIGGIVNPEGTLGNFAGENIGGTWRLDIADGAGGDPGILNEWCLLPALVPSDPDSDGDGVTDSVDNCTDVANADQRDTNGDGFGNVCDFDWNNSCVTNFADLSLFGPMFSAVNGGAPGIGGVPYDEDFDLDNNNVINFLDLGAVPNNFAAAFTNPPGPSANVCVPAP